MAEEEVIFSGGGGNKPPVLMWDGPAAGNGSLRVSAFDYGYSVYALAVSPSGSRLAAGTRAGLLRVHALETFRAREGAKPIFEVFHGADLKTAVLALAFATDGLLASGGQDGQIKVWDVHQGKRVAQIDAHPGGLVALCPLGSLVLASIGVDGFLRVWDLNTLEARHESGPFPLPKIKALTGLDFHPQSGQLVHASRSGDLHVYDTRKDFAKRVVRVHDGDFCAVACGAELVATAGSADASLKLWPPTFDTPAWAVSLAGPVTAVGWAGDKVVMTVSQDGGGQFWRVNHELRMIGRPASQDLRTCVGLPPALIGRSQLRSALEWREQQLADAGALIGQSGSEARQRLLHIIDGLRDRGFSAEASLLIADVARSEDRVLWELESRLALAQGLGDDPAAVPAHYAVAELLERLKEPELAVLHYEKALRIDDNYRDARERIERLRSHAMMAVSPEGFTRADFGKGELIPQELEKYTVLDKKFRWRSVFDVMKLGTEPTKIDLEDLAEPMTAELKRNDSDTGPVDVLRTTMIQGRDRREVQWLSVPCGNSNSGLAYALELEPQGNASRKTAYGVLDPALLHIPDDATASQHNRQVQDAWERLAQSPNTKTWLAEIHESADRAIRHLTARQDHGW